MPCASLVLEPPQKLVQVTTLQHVGNCLVHVIVALLRILQTRKRLKQKNMIHPNIHPLQCLTSLQGCFLRCPLKSPLWPMRRAGQSIRKLAECFRASVSWLLIFSKGCTGRFFRKEWDKMQLFGRNPIFEENRCRDFLIVILVFIFYSYLKGTLSIPSYSPDVFCRLLFFHNAMEKHQGVSPSIFDSNAYDGTMNQLGFAVAFRSRGSTYFSSLPRRGFKVRCCAEWWNVWWKIWKDTKYQELVEMLQNDTIDWL